MKLTPDQHPFLDLSAHRRAEEYNTRSALRDIAGGFLLVLLAVVIGWLVFAL